MHKSEPCWLKGMFKRTPGLIRANHFDDHFLVGSTLYMPTLSQCVLSAFERRVKTLPVIALDRLPLSIGSSLGCGYRIWGVAYLVKPIGRPVA